MNISELRLCIISAATALSDRKEEVNRLNVFPVPDGDTGTNMSLTVESVVKRSRPFLLTQMQRRWQRP